MRWLFIFFIFISTISYSQCKTFRISGRGDTLNCVDMKNLKQGKWIVHVDELRGNPGYEEEGVFKNNMRTGKWRKFSLFGDLLAIENYKWGVKDSTQLYFVKNMLEHEENWHAVDTSKIYDTVYVYDLIDQDKTEKKIIKTESPSVKNGVWKYYNPGSMNVIKKEIYVYNVLMDPLAETKSQTSVVATRPKDTSTIKKDTTKAKPKAVLDYDKKNKGKKTKYIDGSIKF